VCDNVTICKLKPLWIIPIAGFGIVGAESSHSVTTERERETDSSLIRQIVSIQTVRLGVDGSDSGLCPVMGLWY
jgi:hypothetical protein